MTPTDQPDESINANIKEGLDGSQVSLALVATRMCRLLGGATAPLFVIAASLTHGAGRWVLLALTVLLVLGALVKVDERAIRRPIYSVHTMFLSAVVIVLWSWLAPQATVLLAVNVVAGVMYMAMAMERPYSQIAIGTNAVSYVVAQAAFGARGDELWQVLGVAAANILVGGLLLGIRVTTERAMGDSLAERAVAAQQQALVQREREEAERARAEQAAAELATRAEIQQIVATRASRLAATAEDVNTRTAAVADALEGNRWRGDRDRNCIRGRRSLGARLPATDLSTGPDLAHLERDALVAKASAGPKGAWGPDDVRPAGDDYPRT